MTQYEMRQIAKYQAEYLVEALKTDTELADILFPPRNMGIEEAAAFMSIPVGTIYQKISEIPHVKVGRRLVFSDRSLTRYMNRQKDSSMTEVLLKKVM